MNEKVKLLTDNIEKVIGGKTDSVLKIITAMLCGGHVLIEDVPGVGKTQLVSALARKLMSLSIKRVWQCAISSWQTK